MNPEIAKKVREAGIVGAGGAGFPTHVKLNADVERVLGNGASCEPLLMSDPYLMERETTGILRGLALVMESTGSERGTICLKGKHDRAMKTIREAVQRGPFKNIEVFELGDFYPAGDEQILVFEVMGKVVPEGGIPLQVGAVVSNVESLLNISRAVDEGKPVTERYLTVTGEVKKPLVMKVPIGTSIGEVIDFAGGTVVDDFKVVIGGPMMGVVTADLSTPVTKTTSGVIVLPSDHNVIAGKIKDPERIMRITKMVCCQCSRCTDLCPRHLLGHSLEPHKIMRQLGSKASFSKEIMEDALICCECGICEKYACPMMISPREVNAQIKRDLLKDGVKRTPKRSEYRPSLFRDVRKIPTRRLVERLQIGQYEDHPPFMEERMQVQEVRIPLKQHLGAPAVPVVKKGDRVEKGSLIGEIPENALGARVHASMEGRVISVDEAVVIRQ
ncbi:MAG: SLBB domain-containing protein [Deltaproteobacteria bacterium]|nr:SLBB domain-containing protein [Deltaproteobacteria bacterium]